VIYNTVQYMTNSGYDIHPNFLINRMTHTSDLLVVEAGNARAAAAVGKVLDPAFPSSCCFIHLDNNKNIANNLVEGNNLRVCFVSFPIFVCSVGVLF
jgi:hypothetical protein